MKRFDYRKRVWSLGLFVLSMAIVGGFLLGTQRNQANATLAGWNAANIISDYVMTDYNSMNESQIQSFLKSKVNCNNTELWRRSTNKVTWNIKDGHFVCMADDKFGGETAAHIIRQAAVDYKINPKVLIVTLQKESSLITDSMPHSGQYKTAMGFGCPDTAACDSKYFGLKNQIRNAARFFRAYQDNASGWYKPYWTGTYKVHWHPDLNRCGGTNLNIQNRATASLYSYTPYQPNQAALNAGWGTGNTCSSYGNRNFYNYFTSWFGDTRKNIPIVKTDVPVSNYRLVLATDNNRDIQLASASKENRIAIVLGSRQNSNLDSFAFRKNSDGSYALLNNFSGSSIDTPYSNAVIGQELKQWPLTTSDAEKYFIYDNADGTYSIASKLSPHLVFTVDNNKIVLDTYRQDANQRFKIIQAERPLADGYYSFFSKLSTDYVMDVSAGSTSVGANIQTWVKNYTVAQSFYITFSNTAGTYTILPAIGARNRALEVAGGSTAAGANVRSWLTNGSKAQNWVFWKNDDGTFTITNDASGKALDVSNAKTTPGTNIKIWDKKSNTAQKWSVVAFSPIIPSGEHAVSSALSNNFNLMMFGNDTNAVVGYTNNQKFVFTFDNTTGEYVITNKQTGKALDVQGASTVRGADVRFRVSNGTAAQKWKIEKSTNGSYRFVNPNSGKVLDVSGGKTKDLTNTQIWDKNNTNAQNWVIK